jgi:hypothetical protein
MAHDARAEDMAARYERGETLQAIGDGYGLTRERVRQILRRDGRIGAADARSARHAAEVERIARLKVRALQYLAAREPLTRAEAARRLGTDVDDLMEALGDDGPRLLLRAPANEQQDFTGEDCIMAVQQVAGVLGTTSVAAADYEDYRAQNPGLPSSVRLIQRFGTWNQVCAEAGLNLNAGRGNYTRRWSREDLVQFVAAYLAAPGSRGTYAQYDEMAPSHGWASGQTVRDGSWNAAKSAALLAGGRR